MRHFPIFLDTRARRVVVSGAGDCAEAKLRLLIKTEAKLVVFGLAPNTYVSALAQQGQITLVGRAIQPGDLRDTALVYAANDDAALDTHVAEIARAAGVLLNVVDNLNASQFITPAIIDRDPVLIAIGTEGTAPVLARQIKADMEKRLPATLGVLARIAQSFRAQAARLPAGRARRDFWGQYFGGAGAQALADGGEPAVQAKLTALLDDVTAAAQPAAHAAFVAVTAVDLLTLRAHQLLAAADVIVYDADTPADLIDLARREARFVKIGSGLWDGAAALRAQAVDGAQVVRLHDPASRRIDAEIAALHLAGIDHQIVPTVAATRHIKTVENVLLHPALNEFIQDRAYLHG